MHKHVKGDLHVGVTVQGQAKPLTSYVAGAFGVEHTHIFLKCEVHLLGAFGGPGFACLFFLTKGSSSQHQQHMLYF